METYQLLQISLVVMESVAFFTGIWHWKYVKMTHWKWFVIYLGTIMLCEISGLLLLYYFEKMEASRNLYIYFVIPLEFLFFFWLYYRYYEIKQQRNLALAGMAVYCAAFIINAVISPGVTIWQFSLSYLVGVMVMLVLVLQFFYRLIVGPGVLDFKRNMMFWISLGLLVFYLVSSPFFGLKQLLYDRYPKVFWIYYYLHFGVNHLMYFFFTVGFIWGRPR